MREPDELGNVLIQHANSLASPPLLFPVSDGEVMFLADHADRLRRYYRFNLANPELIRRLANKASQYEIAAAAGIPIPPTYFGITSVNAASRDVQFPVVIKPAYSHLWPWRGKFKALEAQSTAELEAHLREMEGRHVDVVVQSIIPGPPTELYTVVAYISHTGRSPVVGSVRKLRHFPLDFGFGSLNEAVRAEELEERAVRFLCGIGFTGVCGIEFKRDPRDSQFKFIEMNPRFELAHHLIAAAGTDVARAMYADLVGEPLPNSTSYRAGLRGMALTLDLKASRALAARGDLSLSAWIRSMRKVRTEALLSWDDPRPGLWSYGRTLRHALLPDRLKAGETKLPGPEKAVGEGF